MKFYYKFLLSFFLLLITHLGYSQIKVGDNHETIFTNSILELEDSTKAFLPTRLTTQQRDTHLNQAQEGYLFYNTTDECMQIYTDSTWECLDIVQNESPLWTDLSCQCDEDNTTSSIANISSEITIPTTINNSALSNNSCLLLIDVPLNNVPQDRYLNLPSASDYTGKHFVIAFENETYINPLNNVSAGINLFLMSQESSLLYVNNGVTQYLKGLNVLSDLKLSKSYNNPDGAEETILYNFSSSICIYSDGTKWYVQNGDIIITE